MPDFDVTLNYQ